MSTPGGRDTLGARLAGHDSVDASARVVRHYRYAVERMMRTMAGWIALTPELSAKLVLGRQVWDNAQHADLWGRRLPELRAPAQVSEPSGPGFVALMDELERVEAAHETVERLVGIHRVLKPHLVAAYAAHLAHANSVYEPPTRRLLARCLDDERRHVAAGEAILAYLAATPALAERARAWQGRLAGLLAASEGVAGAGLPPPPNGLPPLPGGELVDDAREFIRLEAHGRDREVPAELAAAATALGGALVDGDLARVRGLLAPGADVAEADLRQAGAAGATGHRLVAFAKLGGYRLVKQRLEGPRGSLTVLSRWVPEGRGWRASALELGPFDPARPA